MLPRCAKPEERKNWENLAKANGRYDDLIVISESNQYYFNPLNYEATRKGGGELVSLMGTSAWYAPGAAVSQMVEAIVDNQKKIFPVCAYLNGEYGIKKLYLGVPVKLGKGGVEEIIEISLNTEEKKLLSSSAESVKKVMKALDDLKLFEE